MLPIGRLVGLRPFVFLLLAMTSELFRVESLTVARAVARAAVDEKEPTEKEGLEICEKTILPTLKDHCFECHSAKATDLKGNLRVDTKEGLLKGGANGAAVAPRDLSGSFLITAISYQEDDYKMPPRGKLDDDVLKAFDRWIQAGAPDPRKP